MKKRLLMMAMVSSSVFAGTPSMKINGVFDGPLPGGTPKMVEFHVQTDIPDLTIYGFGSANNGNGGGVEEFTFPAGSATAGDFLYLATEVDDFSAYFGFPPNYTNSAVSINGDDAVELFQNGSVIDVFGDINNDGSGTTWEYLDSFVHRLPGTGPDGTVWTEANWTIQAPNSLDGCTTNDTCATTYPLATVPVELMNFSVE